MKAHSLKLTAILAITLVLSIGSASSVRAASDYDPTTGVVAWWRLNEDSGSRADSVGTRNLSSTGSVSAARPSAVLTSALFNGSNYLSDTDSATLSTGAIDFSLAGWVYLDSVATTQPIVAKHAVSGSEYRLSYNSSASRFRWEVFNATSVVGTVDADALGAPVAAQWYFFVVWVDDATGQLGIEIDNAYLNTAMLTGSVADSTASFIVGADGAGGRLTGRVDELAFWKRTLTEEERATLYNGGDGTSYTAATGLMYYNTEYISFDNALPAGWEEYCDNAALQPTHGNTDVLEQSGNPGWGMYIWTSSAVDCTDHEGNPGSALPQYAATRIRRSFPQPLTIEYAQAAKWDGSGANMYMYYRLDGEATTVFNEYIVAGSGGGWRQATHLEQVEDVVLFEFRVSDQGDNTWEEVGLIDDITLISFCTDAPCGSQPLPVTETDFISIPCRPDYGAECSIDAVFETQPEAYVYAPIAGTVLAAGKTKSGMASVTIEDALGNTHIFGNLKYTYVEFGDTVSVGCRIGMAGDYPAETVGYSTETASDIVTWSKSRLLHPTLPPGPTNTIYSDPIGDTYSYATPGEFCNSRYLHSACTLTNPFFANDAAGWTLNEFVQVASEQWNLSGARVEGVRLLGPTNSFFDAEPQSFISQQVVLDDQTSYYVTVGFEFSALQTWPGAYWLGVQLGTAVEEVQELWVFSGGSVQFGPITPVPDGAGGLTTVKIINRSTDFVDLTYACVSESAVNHTPGDCYFVDHTFDDTDTNPPWEYTPGTGTATDPPWGGLHAPGDVPTWVELAIDDVIGQEVTLYPQNGETAANYDLTIRAYPEFPSAASDTGTLTATFDTYSNAFVFDVDDVSDYDGQTDSFSVAASTTADFTFDVTAFGGTMDTLRVESVCLSPGDPGGEWAGYTNALPAPQFQTSCVACTPPDDFLDVGGWIAFLGCLISNLWFCYATQLLNDLLTNLISIARLVYQFATFVANLIYHVLAWFRLLVGTFAALLASLLTDLLNALLSLDLLAGLWDQIALLLHFLDSIVPYFGRLLTLFGKALGLIGSLIGSIDRLIDAFIVAINSAQEAAISFPDCELPADPLYEICVGMGIVDDQFPMTLLNVAVIGGIGIWLTLWTLGVFSDISKD